MINGGRGVSPATLIDPQAANIIYGWKKQRFTVVFLTSRNASERETTLKDLSAVGLEGFDVLITDRKEKGPWLRENYLPNQRKFKNIVVIDDRDHQLQSMVQAGTFTYYLFSLQRANLPLANRLLHSWKIM